MIHGRRSESSFLESPLVVEVGRNVADEVRVASSFVGVDVGLFLKSGGVGCTLVQRRQKRLPVHVNGRGGFCWRCRWSEMSGKMLDVSAVPCSDVEVFLSSAGRWGIWPLDDACDRSMSGIVGGSVFSIKGVVGHFGDAGRVPVSVSVNECWSIK